MTREICVLQFVVLTLCVQTLVPTLTLELCGIAGFPSFADSVTSQTPYSPLVICVVSLFQSSRVASSQRECRARTRRAGHTKIANNICP